ncbi:flagellar protein FlaG [Cupriavidus sp. CuC1]|uniref:flagellar protein FlaG n=1 Tax=Cupriavidus sp. CuC1 TaxID=3373131 RepID=UPI0037CFD756
MANPTSLIPPLPLSPVLPPAGREGTPSAAPASDKTAGTQAGANEQAAPVVTEDAAVQHLKDVLRATSFNVEFEIDPDTHRVITKVVDKDTGEVIRQLPSEEVMRIAHALQKLQGLFVHQEA